MVALQDGRLADYEDDATVDDVDEVTDRPATVTQTLTREARKDPKAPHVWMIDHGDATHNRDGRPG